MLAVVEFLPFRQLIFDKIYLKRSFHHFTDQEAGLKEARRVLKAEGILVIQEVSPERQWKLIQLPERWLRRAHVNFLSLNDSEVKLEREGFHVTYSKPAVAGFFLVANKKQIRLCHRDFKNSTHPRPARTASGNRYLRWGRASSLADRYWRACRTRLELHLNRA